MPFAGKSAKGFFFCVGLIWGAPYYMIRRMQPNAASSRKSLVVLNDLLEQTEVEYVCHAVAVDVGITLDGDLLAENPVL